MPVNLTPMERLEILEKDVKDLKRLIKEMTVREQSLAARLTKALNENLKAQQKIRDLELVTRKTDARVTHVVQSRKSG